MDDTICLSQTGMLRYCREERSRIVDEKEETERSNANQKRTGELTDFLDISDSENTEFMETRQRKRTSKDPSARWSLMLDSPKGKLVIFYCSLLLLVIFDFTITRRRLFCCFRSRDLFLSLTESKRLNKSFHLQIFEDGVGKAKVLEILMLFICLPQSTERQDANRKYEARKYKPILTAK